MMTLQRTAPLRATKNPVSRSRNPLNQVGKGAKRIAPMFTAEREAMLSRANGLCEECSREAPLDAHHTFGRHRTGIPAAVLNHRNLLLALCRPCHARVTTDAHLQEVTRWEALDRYVGHEVAPDEGSALDFLRALFREKSGQQVSDGV